MTKIYHLDITNVCNFDYRSLCMGDQIIFDPGDIFSIVHIINVICDRYDWELSEYNSEYIINITKKIQRASL